MKAPQLHLARLAAVLLLVACIACGGGSSSSSGGSTPPLPPPPPPPPSLTITDNSILPGTLQNYPYSVALHAANAVGALTWSIAPVSPTALFVDGLTIDPSTGILSGTTAFAGTGGFVATVRDSGSPPGVATKGFTITASTPLQAPPPQVFTFRQFEAAFPSFVAVQNGVQPLTFSVTGGTFPAGLRLDGQTGQITGSATAVGVYSSTVTIQDSLSPPEMVTGQVKITVTPPPFSVTSSLPHQILRNRPFSGRVVAVGGIPPYKFTLAAGSLPPGFNPVELNTGRVSGTPTTLGSYFFAVNVSDSSTPAQSSGNNYSFNVVDPIGRNDTIATATPVADGTYYASISPYVDPPDNAPLPADQDYYKIVAVSGSTVHLETQAQRVQPGNPIDTVMEVVDGNGTRQATCRQPGVTSPSFTSSCINDDIGGSSFVLDSALDFKVPGPAGTATTFYVHIVDWRGDARPDMIYSLQVSGAVAPLAIPTTAPFPASRTFAYSQQLLAANGMGAVSWSLTGGTLPPGLRLDSTGLISGSPTADGTFSFTVKASDSSSPPQTATAQESIQVANR